MVPFFSGIPNLGTPMPWQKDMVEPRARCVFRLFLQDFYPLGNSNGTEDRVSILGIFVLWFHHARGS